MKSRMARHSAGNRINGSRRSPATQSAVNPRPFDVRRVTRELEYCHRINPSLRLQLPARASLLAAPKFEICIEFFWRYVRVLSGDDSGREVARLLIELETEHPVEWQYCGWKADAIASLALGTAGRSETVNERRKAFDDWSSQHWKLLQREQNEVDLDLSPLRQAAADAAWDLDVLQFGDDLIQLGMSKERMSERERMRRFIEWLKREWKSVLFPETKSQARLPPRRLCDLRDEALLQQIEKRYRGPKLPISVISELCEAFRKVEVHEITKMTPHSVLLQLVAARHGVSPRLVAEMRAKNAR